MGVAGYRLSPLHLGRLDDLLGMGLPVPLTSSTAAERTPVSAAGPLEAVNGTHNGKEASLPPVPMNVDMEPQTSVVSDPVPAAVAESPRRPGEARPVSAGTQKPVNGTDHAPAVSIPTAVAVSPSPVPIPLIAPQTNPVANHAASNAPTSWAALRERNGERHTSAN